MQRFSKLAIFLALSACATLAWGQATTSLRGTVTDASGSAIRGAQVTVVNASTNFTRTTETGNDGTYVLPELLPGTYNVAIEAKGFSRHEENGVSLRVELPATLNVQMKVGSILETVVVTAEAPILNTTDATMGQTMETNTIENLPLPAENNVLLLSLQPGVAFNGENILQNSYDTRAGMVNGERSDQNNISLDGVSNNDEFAGYAFNGVLPTTPFSVEEFRVTTSNYGASEGRSSGAQIALVTKGGTNKFHGSLYEFNRNGAGEANDFFLKGSQIAGGLPNRPEQLVWNNYGGTIGGPVVKDRLFFFFNYEGHRQNVGQSVERSVPSPMLQDGIIQYQCATPSACTGIERYRSQRQEAIRFNLAITRWAQRSSPRWIRRVSAPAAERSPISVLIPWRMISTTATPRTTPDTVLRRRRRPARTGTSGASISRSPRTVITLFSSAALA